MVAIHNPLERTCESRADCEREGSEVPLETLARVRRADADKGGTGCALQNETANQRCSEQGKISIWKVSKGRANPSYLVYKQVRVRDPMYKKKKKSGKCLCVKDPLLSKLFPIERRTRTRSSESRGTEPVLRRPGRLFRASVVEDREGLERGR